MIMADKTLTLEQIRLVERGALADGLPLMQRAGAAAAAFVMQHTAPGARILVLAGPGNNGGDALVTARLLRAQGYLVHVVLPADPARFPRDAAEAYAQWRAAGGVEVKALPGFVNAVLADSPREGSQDFSRAGLPGFSREGLPDFAREALPDLVIDGLFGIGLSRPLGEPWQTIVDTVNGLGCPILALDIPSGLDAQTGDALGRPIQATWTIAFIAPAQGLETPHGRALAGECVCDRLGLTEAMIARYLGALAG